MHSLAEALPPLAGESELLLLIGDLNLQSHSPRLFHLMQAANLESAPSLSSGAAHMAHKLGDVQPGGAGLRESRAGSPS